MSDEELKELRDKLDLCYQPGGKLVWSEVKKVLEDAYDLGYYDGLNAFPSNELDKQFADFMEYYK